MDIAKPSNKWHLTNCRTELIIQRIGWSDINFPFFSSTLLHLILFLTPPGAVSPSTLVFIHAYYSTTGIPSLTPTPPWLLRQNCRIYYPRDIWHLVGLYEAPPHCSSVYGGLQSFPSLVKRILLAMPFFGLVWLVVQGMSVCFPLLT